MRDNEKEEKEKENTNSNISKTKSNLTLQGSHQQFHELQKSHSKPSISNLIQNNQTSNTSINDSYTPNKSFMQNHFLIDSNFKSDKKLL